MTILVAGATGLAGSAVVRELTRIGRPVVGISSKEKSSVFLEAGQEFWVKSFSVSVRICTRETFFGGLNFEASKAALCLSLPNLRK